MAARFKNFLLSILILLLTLVGLELFFRTVRRDDALKLVMGQVDLKYHHSLKPNSDLHLVSSLPGEYEVTARINNHGFRGPDFDLSKKSGQIRIFVVGDSFTFGTGTHDDETIPALMQQKLDSTAERIQVVNAGIGSYSPVTHYLRLRDDLPNFKPDIVLMLLDFSDLRDDWDREKTLLFDQQGEVIGSNPYYEYGKFKLWNYLRSKSVFCMYLHNKLVRSFQKIRKLGLGEYVSLKIRGERSKAVIATQREDTIEFDGRLLMRGRAKADEIRTHFKRTAKYILMCRKLSQDHDAGFILVMYPYGIYVGPEQWAKGRIFWGFEEHKVYTDYFAFDLVRDFAEEHHIPFINLLNDLLAHKDEALFFPYDGHFTPRANEIAAEALTENPTFKEILDAISR